MPPAQTEIQAQAQQFIEALHRLEQGGAGEVDPMVRLFSDDTRITSSALRLAGDERRGTAGGRQFWEEYQRLVGAASSDFHQVTTNERAAGLFWRTTGTSSTGQPIAYDGVSLLVF